HAQVDAHGQGVRAAITGTVRIAGDQLALEAAKLRATATDPARASGGKAPVHGALRVDLDASGALRPAPRLAVRGSVEGRQRRVQDRSVGALQAAVDAREP